MSKKQTYIQFGNLFQLWQFAQTLNVRSIEIRTSDKLLICECSQADLQFLHHYHGKIIEQESSQFSESTVNGMGYVK